MNVKLLYFAALREQLGSQGEEIALPRGVTTVAALQVHLQGRGGSWQSALAANRALGVAVNQEIAQGATPVKAGDEIAFFPPVTGG